MGLACALIFAHGASWPALATQAPGASRQSSSGQSAGESAGQSKAPLPDAPQPSQDQGERGTAAETAPPEPANAAPPRTGARPPEPTQDAGPNRKPEQSSSEQSRGDISPPREDELAHPTGGGAPGAAGVREWNPLRAMKDVEIGTFYYNQGNYKAAISRFREALEYKPRDAAATFKLAEALEKSGELDEARVQYESYLAILKDGPSAGEARKALERLRKK